VVGGGEGVEGGGRRGIAKGEGGNSMGRRWGGDHKVGRGGG